MATPPNRDNTILDIHSDDAGSQGPFADKEREGGTQYVVGGNDETGRWFNQFRTKCASNIAKLASEEKIETSFTRNKLPLQEHCIKQETDPQSSLVKANIPATTQVTYDQETFFETCKVSKESQLLSLPHNLHTLKIEGCESLVILPDNLLDGFPILKELDLINCSSLKFIPYPASLTTLNIRNCRNFELLHWLESTKKLSSIENMFIRNSCDSLITLTLDLFPKLKGLGIGKSCDKLTSQKDWGLENLESLSNFNIEGECLGMESFPEKPLPKTIKALRISKLKSLRKLDDQGFQQLNALVILKINCCDVLRYLPEQRFPFTLNRLYIRECPLLTPRLDPETGKYWHKVAHMSHIEIDHKRVWESRYRY